MRINMKRMLNLIIVLFIGIVLIACSKKDSIILATTTSTDNSGLLDYLLPFFEEEKDISVKVIAVGTGAALEMGRMGEADILMVHDKPSELQFMDEGYGIKRSDLMYNDFVIVGPNEIGDNTLESVLTKIKETESKFISREDNSGTHIKELFLWEKYGIEPNGDWYDENGQGMGATLTIASEDQAYTITDRATYLSMKDNLDLEIVYENNEDLFNQYGVILINPELHKNIKYEDALIFYDWLISEKAQNLINQFGKEIYDQSLFMANAPKE